MPESLTSTITVKKRALLNVLSQFRLLAKLNFLNKPAHIAVFPSHIEISLPGVFQTVDVKANGQYHVHIPLAILESYAQTAVQKELTFEISNGLLKCGPSQLSHSAIRVADLLFELENPLPLNPADRDYLRLTTIEGLKPDEETTELIKKAKRRFKRNLNTAVMPLKEYGITVKELEAFIMGKLAGS